MTPLGILGARRTTTRSNPDDESFQEIFDLESLIRKANKLQRLDINFSLPAEGVVSIDDISEHCGEELEIVFPNAKSEFSLSEVVLEPSTCYIFLRFD